MTLHMEGIRELLRRLEAAGGAGPLQPSSLWKQNHEQLHRRAVDEIDDVDAFIHLLTENNAFTFPRHHTDPECGPLAKRYLAWLSAQGTPITGFDAFVQESPLVGEKALFRAENRLLSTMFLLHLCMAVRIRQNADTFRSVLEIGGGYGGLARILKLLQPDLCYTIVDLPESLCCSYAFLARHFPRARLGVVTEKGELARLGPCDFLFVPTARLEELEGQRFDLAINTASLDEMTQESVDGYMQLLEHGARVRWFYSINRFGLRDHYCPPDLAHTSVRLGRDWRVRVWDLWGEKGVAQLEPIAPPYLELLAEHVPEAAVSASEFAQVSAQLLDEAGRLEPNSSRWHYCMWNSIRYLPSRDNLEPYIAALEARSFPEAAGYRALLADAVEHAPALSGSELAASSPVESEGDS